MIYTTISYFQEINPEESTGGNCSAEKLQSFGHSTENLRRRSFSRASNRKVGHNSSSYFRLVCGGSHWWPHCSICWRVRSGHIRVSSVPYR